MGIYTEPTETPALKTRTGVRLLRRSPNPQPGFRICFRRNPLKGPPLHSGYFTVEADRARIAPVLKADTRFGLRGEHRRVKGQKGLTTLFTASEELGLSSPTV